MHTSSQGLSQGPISSLERSSRRSADTPVEPTSKSAPTAPANRHKSLKDREMGLARDSQHGYFSSLFDRLATAPPTSSPPPNLARMPNLPKPSSWLSRHTHSDPTVQWMGDPSCFVDGEVVNPSTPTADALSKAQELIVQGRFGVTWSKPASSRMPAFTPSGS